jgi:hypothetical protein
VEKWSQVPVPSGSWQDYVTSLVPRRMSAKTDEYLRSVNVPMGTWCHGDLSLENVLVDLHRVMLIDPNPGLFWSHWLDIGKLAFSLEYHDIFRSYWLTAKVHGAVVRNLRKISHIVRLNGYRDQPVIDDWVHSCL